MDFWAEFLWGREFVAGGFGGMAGIFAGQPLDTVRIRQQQSSSGSMVSILRNLIARDGPLALYRGMGAPLASVTFQNAMVFQIYAVLSRAFDSPVHTTDPPSYRGVALGGVGAGTIQCLIITPVELLKIRLQLQTQKHKKPQQADFHKGPISFARSIFKAEGLRGIYRGLTITVIRDAPSHGIYFWTYEYMKEQLHPGCRKSGQESFKTMLIAGGLAGVSSWICCYPLDVIKTRLQAESQDSPSKYKGIVDCFRRSIKAEGYSVLWRGLGTTLSRAFVVNGVVFTAYETALRCFFNNNHGSIHTGNNV